MDAFFTGLTKRQAMLLLTTVTFGGPEGVEAFDHLPDEEADVLRDRAKQILAIPREKRVPFLVQEIKRFITGRKTNDLRALEPKQIARALKQERPALTEVILRALPSQLATEVRTQLAHIVVPIKEVRPDVLAVIRWKFEQQVAELLPERPGFMMSDLLTLAPRDLLCLADVLGARALGPALAALPNDEREAFLKPLPPDQRHLLKRSLSEAVRRPSADEARTALADAGREVDERERVRAAGLRRVARAAVSESGEFASRLVERHRGDLGRLLARFISEERQTNKREHGARSELLSELEKLAVRGVVDRPMRLPPPPQVRSATPPSIRPPPPRTSLPSQRAPGVQRGGAAASDPSLRTGRPPPRPSRPPGGSNDDR